MSHRVRVVGRAVAIKGDLGALVDRFFTQPSKYNSIYDTSL